MEWQRELLHQCSLDQLKSIASFINVKGRSKCRYKHQLIEHIANSIQDPEHLKNIISNYMHVDYFSFQDKNETKQTEYLNIKYFESILPKIKENFVYIKSIELQHKTKEELIAILLAIDDKTPYSIIQSFTTHQLINSILMYNSVLKDNEIIYSIKIPSKIYGFPKHTFFSYIELFDISIGLKYYLKDSRLETYRFYNCAKSRIEYKPMSVEDTESKDGDFHPLPNEILHQIYGYLDTFSKLQFLLTNKNMYQKLGSHHALNWNEKKIMNQYMNHSKEYVVLPKCVAKVLSIPFLEIENAMIITTSYIFTFCVKNFLFQEGVILDFRIPYSDLFFELEKHIQKKINLCIPMDEDLVLFSKILESFSKKNHDLFVPLQMKQLHLFDSIIQKKHYLHFSLIGHNLGEITHRF